MAQATHHHSLWDDIRRGLTVSLVVSACAMLAATDAGRANVAAGKGLFHQHCAVCHGSNANGDSSYESGTYLPPRQPSASDLTSLSIDNGGTFPAARVRDAIHCTTPHPQSGTPDMPAWGNVFYDLKSTPAVYEQRVRDITAYIESIQTMPVRVKPDGR